MPWHRMRAAPYNFRFCVKGSAMPIYAYRCSACGHARDVLQKMSDPLLSTCPACGAATFTKQVTAAGFQLKGSGWYATDFKSSGAAPVVAPPAGEGQDKAAGAEKSDAADKPADKSGDKSGDKGAPAPAAAPAAPAAGGPTAAPAAS